MQHKIIKLTLVLVVLFSLQTQAQTESKHPKMDKYYPPAPTLASPNTPENTEAPIIKQATGPVVETKPTPVVPEKKPAPAISSKVPPEAILKPSPVISSTVTPPLISQPVAPTVTPDTTTKETPVTAIEKPANVAPQPLPQQRVSIPPTDPYNPNRLGSSTKQYDTWEKNSDGAGSVTTHSK
jgi:hypothetical protein